METVTKNLSIKSQIILKKIIKYSSRLLLGFIGFILIYLLSSFCLSRITIDKEENTKEEVQIFIKSNGVHTDIVVPIDQEQKKWSNEIKFENTISKDTTYQYVGLGWGDKGFYLETPSWSDLKVSTAFKAATGLSSTAIHATFFKKMNLNSNCKEILISKEQYQRLIEYIDNSFQKDENGHYIKIETNANYSNNDAFYEAKGSYSMFQTCNSWANNGLKQSGQKCCVWTPFDTGIFLNYQTK